MTITRDQAETLVGELVTARGVAAGDEFVVMQEKTVETHSGWVFFYNTVEFVETGDPIAALAGNGPIFVSTSGEMTDLPTATPWQEAIKTL